MYGSPNCPQSAWSLVGSKHLTVTGTAVPFSDIDTAAWLKSAFGRLNDHRGYTSS